MSQWYKIAQGEYIGPGSPVSTGIDDNIVQQPGKNRLSDGNGAGSDYMGDQSGDGRNSPHSTPKISCKDKSGKTLIEGERCPGCQSFMQKEEFHLLSEDFYYFHCNNYICSPKTKGYDSRDLGGWDLKVRSSRLKQVKTSSISPFIEAAAPVTPYNNIANQPFGNLDISTDIRVIPWSRIEPDYMETWDTQKQKKKLDYRIKKIKDHEGKIRFIKVKDNMKGSGVQPANTYNQKGDIKRQPRFDLKDGVPKGNSTGAWPHNRGQDPSEGWYGATFSTDKDRFNADGRTRYQLWDEFVRERDLHMPGFVKPM